MMDFKKYLVALVALGLVGSVAACADDSDDSHAAAAHTGAVHWTYSGDTGPAKWGTLDTTYATCKDGTSQSPIDIAAATVHSDHLLTGITLKHADSPINIVNNGHTIQVNYAAGSMIEYGGKSYELLQFHFHAHSEHTVDGNSFPMEAHFVHKATDGTLAVIGVFIKAGAKNTLLEKVFANLPKTENATESVTGATVNAKAILESAATDKGWTYDGSLTTPPCTEGVKWIVMESPIEADAAQIKAYTDLFSDNFRPVQPLGTRHVTGGAGGGTTAPHWGYGTGSDGPGHWGDLDTAWATCKTGTTQSPIDIDNATVSPGVASNLTFSWVAGAPEITNNGHTIQVNMPAGSKIAYAGKDYELLQFHFHAHSEHTVGGTAGKMELHLVHKAADGTLAVIGVMINDGTAEHAELKKVLDNLPAKSGDKTSPAGVTVDANAFLPTDKSVWTYSGSLTTPPCTEGVSWVVMANSVETTAAQIGKFTALYGDNFRPVTGASVTVSPGM